MRCRAAVLLVLPVCLPILPLLGRPVHVHVQLVLVWDFVASSLKLKPEEQVERATFLCRTMHAVVVTFGIVSLLLSLLFVYGLGPSPEAAHLVANMCAAVLAVLVLACGVYAALHVKRTLVGLRSAATRQQVGGTQSRAPVC